MRWWNDSANESTNRSANGGRTGGPGRRPRRLGARGAVWPMRLVAVFLVLTAVRVWVGPVGFESRVSAQVPREPFGSAGQRDQMVKELRQVNQTLSAILQTLKTGVLKVQPADPGKKAPARPGSGR